jgi:hypothetical protein
MVLVDAVGMPLTLGFFSGGSKVGARSVDAGNPLDAGLQQFELQGADAAADIQVMHPIYVLSGDRFEQDFRRACWTALAIALQVFSCRAFVHDLVESGGLTAVCHIPPSDETLSSSAAR